MLSPLFVFLCLYTTACTGLSTSRRDLVVITGASGTLGRALCDKFIKTRDLETITILAGCRDIDKGDDIYSVHPNVFTFECNFDGVTQPGLPSFYLDCLPEFQSVTLINNAAVCLQGEEISLFLHLLNLIFDTL